MTDVVIVAAGRTAVGKFGGTLAKFPAADLGAHVIRALLARTGLKPEQISEVILGQVLTAGVGQNAARQALIKASLRRFGAGKIERALLHAGLIDRAIKGLARNHEAWDEFIALGLALR